MRRMKRHAVLPHGIAEFAFTGFSPEPARRALWHLVAVLILS